MSTPTRRIEVDRTALFEVIDYFWCDASEEYLAAAAEDKPCCIFPRLATLAEDMARQGDRDALALLPVSIRDAIEAQQKTNEVFEL